MEKLEAREGARGVTSTALLQIARTSATLLRDQPALDPMMRLCIAAWRELDGDRPVWGDALGPIPWTAIDAWCRARQLGQESAELVAHALAIADSERAKRRAAKRTTDNATGAQRGGKGR
jgi:hypothetical protein